MIQRIGKMGGIAMIHNPHQPSAFVTTYPPHLMDEDSISGEFMHTMGPARAVRS
jgi:hypothetical protein